MTINLLQPKNPNERSQIGANSGKKCYAAGSVKTWSSTQEGAAPGSWKAGC